MSIKLSDSIRVGQQKPLDDKYFNELVHYTSTSQVNNLVSKAIRHIGLTVNINGEEYWYKDGIEDSNLVPKIPNTDAFILKNQEQDSRLENLEGIHHIWFPTSKTLILCDREGNMLSQIYLASLDNEGTDIRYNATTLSLELYNADNQLLDSIPVSSFIGSVGTQLQLNSNQLQLKDSQGNILSTVTFEISNIQGLQTALDGKQNNIILTTTGNNGSATLVGNTVNIPSYTLAGLGGVPTTRTLTINGSALDLSTNRTFNVGTVTSVSATSPLSSTEGNTPTISIQQANGSQSGFLSSTDWNTFNNKQNNLNYTPENTLNKSSDVLADKASSIKFPTVKAVYDYLQPEFNSRLKSYSYDSFSEFPIGVQTDAFFIDRETGAVYIGWTDPNYFGDPGFGGTYYKNISLQLGSTQSTAFRGDLGQIAYDHSIATGNPHGTKPSDIGLGNVENTKDADKPISTATQTALNNKQDKLTNPITGTGTGTTNKISKFTANGVIGDSIIYENNNSISIGDDVSDARLRVKAQGSNAADIVLRVRNSANTRDFLVVNGTGDVYNKGAQGVASNTFFGENVGRNTTGGNNTALGYNAFSSNTLGVGNSAFGDYALSANTLGTGNSAFGNYSLSANTTGENNTAFGGNTLSSNISGVSNSAFGEAALWANTTGGDNSAFGDHALSENTTGKNNIAIGSSAGRSISDGTPLINATSSVFVGCNTKSSKNGNTNEIVIGQSAIGNGSNTATIGNDSTTDVYLKGITNSNGFKTPTGTPNQALTANGGVFDLDTKFNIGLDTVVNFKNISAMTLTDFRSKIPDTETIYFTEEQNSTGWQQIRYNGLGITIPATTETLIALTNENFIELDSDSTFNLIGVTNTKINGIFEKDFVIIKFNADVVTPATTNQWFKVILKINDVKTAVSPVFYLTESSGTVEQIAHNFALNVPTEMITNGATLHLKTSTRLTFNNPAISVLRVHKSTASNL